MEMVEIAAARRLQDRVPSVRVAGIVGRVLGVRAGGSWSSRRSGRWIAEAWVGSPQEIPELLIAEAVDQGAIQFADVVRGAVACQG